MSVHDVSLEERKVSRRYLSALCQIIVAILLRETWSCKTLETSKMCIIFDILYPRIDKFEYYLKKKKLIMEKKKL